MEVPPPPPSTSGAPFPFPFSICFQFVTIGRKNRTQERDVWYNGTANAGGSELHKRGEPSFMQRRYEFDWLRNLVILLLFP